MMDAQRLDLELLLEKVRIENVCWGRHQGTSSSATTKDVLKDILTWLSLTSHIWPDHVRDLPVVKVLAY